MLNEKKRAMIAFGTGKKTNQTLMVLNDLQKPHTTAASQQQKKKRTNANI